MAEFEQVSKQVELKLASGRPLKNITYYVQDVNGQSPNLGTELAKHRIDGPRQRLGIYTPQDTVVWSNDPKVLVHYDLTLAEKTTRLAQFQTTKYPREYIARINVAGLDINALLKISQYILNSEPSQVQRIILNLVSDYTYYPEENQEIFNGTVNQLQNKISDLS